MKLNQDKKILVGNRNTGNFRLNKDWLDVVRYGKYGRYDGSKEIPAALLLLTMIYKAQLMTIDKLKGMLKSLKAGTLLGYKTNYNAKKINGIWYNEEDMINILDDITPKLASVTIEDLIKVINLYMNVPRNYCIDYIYSEYFKPLLSYFEPKYNLLKEIIGDEYLTYEEAERRYYLDDGYCCYDCDGCLGEYKRRRYEYRYKQDKEKIKSMVIKYLTDLKNPTTKNKLDFE